MRINYLRLYRVELPLATPYRLSYRTFESFEPLVVEIEGEDGRVGWGEQHISPGSSAETREGGWAFVTDLAGNLVGRDTDEALGFVRKQAARSKVAATAIATAIEMLANTDILKTATDTRLPLLTPFNATELSAIEEEVERRLEQGFATFKIKVGKDVAADLARIEAIQHAAAGRATLRLDANRAFDREQGVAFASALDPNGIALFEQPCAAEDWEANAAVAAASRVPLMLDEPICTIADIDRAAEIDGVGYCKLKLKRFVSLADLERALKHVRARGLKPVLGDGLGAEINCWMEACVAQRTIDNAGEFNGYVKIKPEHRLLANPLGFDKGYLVMPAGYRPEMDRRRLAAHTLQETRFARTTVRMSVPQQ